MESERLGLVAGRSFLMLVGAVIALIMALNS